MSIESSIHGAPFFSSWSGGKDSCLALYRAIEKGGAPKFLFTMMTEGGERSRSHGLPLALLEKQAASLGLPLVVRSSSWSDYERNFVSAISELKRDGARCGVFGDIDLDHHLEWVQGVCSAASIIPCEPLWKGKRETLLGSFLDLGFKAVVVAVKEGVLDRGFLGRTLDRRTISEMTERGVDASGELGEYHTVVVDGPLFSSAIRLELKDTVVRDGYCFIDAAPAVGPS